MNAWTGAGSMGDAAERAAGDLTWISTLERITARREAVLMISMRYFGGENPRRTAASIEISQRRLRAIQLAINLPRDSDQRKFGEFYDAVRARVTLARSGYELVHNEGRDGFVWRHRDARAPALRSRACIETGGPAPCRGRRRARIALVTWADLEAACVPAGDTRH